MCLVQQQKFSVHPQIEVPLWELRTQHLVWGTQERSHFPRPARGIGAWAGGLWYQLRKLQETVNRFRPLWRRPRRARRARTRAVTVDERASVEVQVPRGEVPEPPLRNKKEFVPIGVGKGSGVILPVSPLPQGSTVWGETRQPMVSPRDFSHRGEEEVPCGFPAPPAVQDPAGGPRWPAAAPGLVSEGLCDRGKGAGQAGGI